MNPLPRTPLRLLLGLAGLELAALAWLATADAVELPRLLAGYGIAFAAYVGTLAVVRRAPPPTTVALAAGLALRLPWLPASPLLSDDVWRYLHDGRAQLAGVNPYRYPPAAAEADAFAGPERERINHPELRTVYPPAAQLAFLLAALPGPSVLAWKLVLLASEAVLVGAILLLLRARGSPPGAVAAYTLHPLPVVEFAGMGHADAVAIAALVLALALLERGRSAAAGIALGVSTGAKYLALPLIPLAARSAGARGPVLAATAAGSLVLLALFYAGASPLGSLGAFAVRFEFNGSVYQVAALALAPRTARVVLGLLLLGVLGVLWRRRIDAETAAFVWIGGLLLASPIVHPWYLTWLVPFFAWRTAPWAMTWTGTVFLAYAVLPRWLAEGVWHLPVWALWMEYGTVAGVWLVWRLRHGDSQGAAWMRHVDTM